MAATPTPVPGTGPGLDRTALRRTVNRVWNDEAIPVIAEYIALPALSPHFDPEWSTHGHLDAAVNLAVSWAASRPIDGLVVTRRDLEGHTPVITLELPATPGCEDAGTVLCYGHLDKQPEMSGWSDGLGPWTPVREGDRLYGRGGADDGYALFGICTALEALQAAGATHGRCIAIIEASEESASIDLEHHLAGLGGWIGSPDLVVCLDSGCGDYERLWVTTSLRGLLQVDLTVRVLTEGVHSGAAGGVVPSSFRLARRLLDGLEDAATGRLLVTDLHPPIPPDRQVQAAEMAATLGRGPAYPFAGDTRPVSDDPAQQYLDRTWRPALEVIGAGGLPGVGQGGNVLRPETTLCLSIRLPPGVDPEVAATAVTRTLTADPPYGAEVTVTVHEGAAGWNAPTTAGWLDKAVDDASTSWFGRPARWMGEGGTIPFMALLGRRFPDAQFCVTGVLGPESNAHGPNEFLHVPYAERLVGCVADVIHAHSVSQHRARAAQAPAGPTR